MYLPTPRQRHFALVKQNTQEKLDFEAKEIIALCFWHNRAQYANAAQNHRILLLALAHSGWHNGRGFLRNL